VDYIDLNRAEANPVESTPAQPVRLTARERQIVELVVDGCSNQEIAERLLIRPQTVKNQLSLMYAKVGVTTRVQLAVYAVRQGLAV
jgi:DNA-binding NarL/FixJ family response regulator